MQRKRMMGPVLTGITVLLAVTFLQGQGRVDRDIVFSDQDGECVLTASPSQARAKRNFTVAWRVQNECETEITVMVGNFRLNGQPVTPMDRDTSATIGAGRQAVIVGMVRGDAAFGTYNYDVSLEGAEAFDPELVIDP